MSFPIMLRSVILNHLKRFPVPRNHWSHPVNILNKHEKTSSQASCERQLSCRQVLCKYNKKSTLEEDSDDEYQKNAEFKDERDSKVVKFTVNSLRADLLLKAGLGMARNKVEKMFYSSKIRVNGQKLAKKSETLDVGDEIDVIRGLSQSNPSHLVVSRVIVLSANEREDGYSVTMRRYKSLLIDNYAGINAYKSSENAAT